MENENEAACKRMSVVWCHSKGVSVVFYFYDLTNFVHSAKGFSCKMEQRAHDKQ